jgi:hypothetical protein
MRECGDSSRGGAAAQELPPRDMSCLIVGGEHSAIVTAASDRLQSAGVHIDYIRWRKPANFGEITLHVAARRFSRA